MITAIIPCYNAEPYLAEAIESILAQSRKVDEILLVDDCSTDNSLAIAKKYPVTTLQTETNRGHAAARNLAVKQARGEIVAWLDADDYWLPHHIETVAPLLERFPQAGVVHSTIERVGTESGLSDSFFPENEPTDLFWESFRRTLIPIISALMPRQAYLAVGGFDESIRFAPDFDFWLRLSQRYPFVRTHAVTAAYRWHESQISSNPEKQIESVYRARSKFLQQTEQQGDTQLAAQLRARMLEIWETEMRNAWYRGDSHRVRFLLTLAEHLPAADALTARWRQRARLPGLLVKNTRRLIGRIDRLLRPHQ